MKVKKADCPKFAEVEIEKIVPADWNPRKIDEASLSRLQDSLVEWGNLEPVVINARTNSLVAGHQRLKCLIQQGEEKAPVWYVWLTDHQEKAANVVLNRHAGQYETDKLATIMGELEDLDLDLEITGFKSAEINRAMGRGAFQGGDTSGNTSNLIDWEIIFSSQQDRETWMEYLGKIREEYPDCDSTVEMLVCDLEATMAADG